MELRNTYSAYCTLLQSLNKHNDRLLSAVEEIREGKVHITKEGEDDFTPVATMESPLSFTDAEASETEDAE